MKKKIKDFDGASLDLTAASYVVLCEPCWRIRPTTHVNRVHRFDQKFRAHNYKLYTFDSFADEALDGLKIQESIATDRIMTELFGPDEEQPVIPEHYKRVTEEH